MSLKPLKKSDLGKGWMKRRQERKIPIQPEYHLIVTEGIATEPQYFESIKNQIDRKFPGRIHLDIVGEGCNTIGLFNRANSLALASHNTYKHVWVVYDTDDFPPENINTTAILCENNSSEDTQYHAIWSNQCIEIWFLLHFSFFQSDIHRRDYWDKLNRCLNNIGQGDYSKNRDDMYEILRPFMDKAIANAKKLAEHNKGKHPSQSSPGTMVHILVEKLRPYL